MKMLNPKVAGYAIRRRTFEGKTNPKKNDCSLTSKYMPSHKYWLMIDWGNYSSEYTYPTKAQCLTIVEDAKKRAGKPL